MSGSDSKKPTSDPVSEGVRAHQRGKPRDACPYPAKSEQRQQWLEGYDGRPRNSPPDLPIERS
nr:Rmf/CrpP family protein [Methylobacterium nodulans]